MHSRKFLAHALTDTPVKLAGLQARLCSAGMGSRKSPLGARSEKDSALQDHADNTSAHAADVLLQVPQHLQTQDSTTFAHICSKRMQAIYPAILDVFTMECKLIAQFVLIVLIARGCERQVQRSLAFQPPRGEATLQPPASHSFALRLVMPSKHKWRRVPWNAPPAEVARRPPPEAGVCIFHDWRCGLCPGRNSWEYTSCTTCGEPRGPRSSWREPEWECAQCRTHMFMDYTSCRKCRSPSGLTISPAAAMPTTPGMLGRTQRSPSPSAVRQQPVTPPLQAPPPVPTQQQLKKLPTKKEFVSEEEMELAAAVAAYDAAKAAGVGEDMLALLEAHVLSKRTVLEDSKPLHVRLQAAVALGDELKRRSAECDDHIIQCRSALEKATSNKTAIEMELAQVEARVAELSEACAGDQTAAASSQSPSPSYLHLLQMLHCVEETIAQGAEVAEPVKRAASEARRALLESDAQLVSAPTGVPEAPHMEEEDKGEYGEPTDAGMLGAPHHKRKDSDASAAQNLLEHFISNPDDVGEKNLKEALNAINSTKRQRQVSPMSVHS